MSDLSRLIDSVADDVEAILARHPGPGLNPTALKQLRFQADRLTGRAAEAAAKVRELVVLAEDLYSATRHARSARGAAGLRARMHEQIVRLREMAQARSAGDD